MPITLAQHTVGMSNKVDHQIIDTIRRNSRLMDLMIYDDAVTPEGGSTLVYAYTQLKTAGVANGRALNSDYTPAEAERETKTTSLQIMGGSYQIDRVLANNQPRFINEVTFQNEEKAKATTARFQYLAINGDKSNTNEFDGLATLLAGTSNDFTAAAVDLSSAMTATKAENLAAALDEVIASIQDGADAILCNTKTATKIKAAARQLGYKTESEDAFGRGVDKYNGIEIIDMGKYYNGTSTVDVIATDPSAKTAPVYVVNLSRTGFHAITPQGGVGISHRLPDFSTAGAVKTGDVEMVAGVVLKNTNNAGVFKVKLA